MDRQQQDALYSEAAAACAPELRRLVRGYEANTESQRDLLQEIHLQLWRSLAGFDQRCSLRTWTLRVAHNVGGSHIARALRSPKLVDLDQLPAELPAAVDEQLAALLALIQRLNVLDRQIILLYLEGEDAAAIAEITGLTANNIATKVHRIKKLLRQWSSEGAAHV